ncbi:ATP-binding protein [Streptomyces sp. NPDC002138]|uniref:ATP-binding protein n=1 Tax=Streptomyces sp. NPDC002138 TaxID=3154410 RepID=UPI00332D2072
MSAPAVPAVPVCAQRFSPTPRGAGLARRLTLLQLEDWGVARETGTSDAVAAIVAELVANAVTHGKVPGRDFELRLILTSGSIRIEVADAGRGGTPRVAGPADDAESGRGLLLVEAFSSSWGVTDQGSGKIVWAVRDLTTAEAEIARGLAAAPLSKGP